MQLLYLPVDRFEQYVIPSSTQPVQNQIVSISMALRFRTHNTNTAGIVNKKENIKKKPLLLQAAEIIQIKYIFPLHSFLTKTKAQLRAVIYNELALPVFISFPFLTGMCQF